MHLSFVLPALGCKCAFSLIFSHTNLFKIKVAICNISAITSVGACTWFGDLHSYKKLCISHNTECPHCDLMSSNNFERKSKSISAILFSCPVTPIDWNANAQKSLRAALNNIPITKPAKNVIVFVGDGLGVSTVTAARILKGQLQGQLGEEASLSFEEFPNVALSKVSGAQRGIIKSVWGRFEKFPVTLFKVRGACLKSFHMWHYLRQINGSGLKCFPMQHHSMWVKPVWKVCFPKLHYSE